MSNDECERAGEDAPCFYYVHVLGAAEGFPRLSSPHLDENKLDRKGYIPRV